MPIDRPLKRTIRRFTDGSYSNSGNWKYLLHPMYVKNPQHYIRSFLLIQEDLQKLFKYVEPSDLCFGCFGDALYIYRFEIMILLRVKAKSLLCYWAVRDLGIGMVQIARRLNLSLAGVSQSVKPGETIVQQSNKGATISLILKPKTVNMEI